MTLPNISLKMWKATTKKGVAKHFKPEAAELLEACIEGIKALPEFNLETTEALYNKIAEEHGLSLGKAIHPTRLALTGRTVSPGLFDVMVLLGREKNFGAHGKSRRIY